MPHRAETVKESAACLPVRVADLDRRLAQMHAFREVLGEHLKACDTAITTEHARDLPRSMRSRPRAAGPPIARVCDAALSFEDGVEQVRIVRACSLGLPPCGSVSRALSARTSNPELIERLREADAHSAALESECHLASGSASDGLIERLAWQTQVTEQLAADVEHDV